MDKSAVEVCGNITLAVDNASSEDRTGNNSVPIKEKELLQCFVQAWYNHRL